MNDLDETTKVQLTGNLSSVFSANTEDNTVTINAPHPQFQTLASLLANEISFPSTKKRKKERKKVIPYMSRSFHKIHLPFTQPRTVFSATGQLYERLHLLSRPFGKNVISSQFAFERGRELRASFFPLLDIIFGQGYRETSIGVLKRFSMHRYIYISDPINARRYAPPPPPLSNKNGMRQFSCNDRLNPLEERRTSRHYQRPRRRGKR